MDHCPHLHDLPRNALAFRCQAIQNQRKCRCRLSTIAHPPTCLMTQSFSSPQVVCRPALPRDHADIAEFCKGIWEGGDYVPDVWQHWFKDPHGLLVTAEFKGHAIGCAKLSLIDEGQWWLEGVRVDPNHQGLKVGSRMHYYLTDWWAEHCDGTLRLLTENPAMEHLCLKTGYVKTQELRGYNPHRSTNKQITFPRLPIRSKPRPLPFKANPSS